MKNQAERLVEMQSNDAKKEGTPQTASELDGLERRFEDFYVDKNNNNSNKNTSFSFVSMFSRGYSIKKWKWQKLFTKAFFSF